MNAKGIFFSLVLVYVHLGAAYASDEATLPLATSGEAADGSTSVGLLIETPALNRLHITEYALSSINAAGKSETTVGLQVFDGNEMVHELVFKVSESGAFQPKELPFGPPTVRIWSTANKEYANQTFFLQADGTTKDRLLSTLNFVDVSAPPRLGVGTLSEQDAITQGEDFQKIVVIEDSGTNSVAILVGTHDDELTGVRFAMIEVTDDTLPGDEPYGLPQAAGPWWPRCCEIFARLCGNSPACNQAADRCRSGGRNPCHRFDSICLICWILARVFH